MSLLSAVAWAEIKSALAVPLSMIRLRHSL
jgi:hypothetical protein